MCLLNTIKGPRFVEGVRGKVGGAVGRDLE